MMTNNFLATEKKILTLHTVIARVRIVGGLEGLNPPVILSTPQLMLLEVPQGVGHNPPTMTNVNKCMG